MSFYVWCIAGAAEQSQNYFSMLLALLICCNRQAIDSWFAKQHLTSKGDVFASKGCTVDPRSIGLLSNYHALVQSLCLPTYRDVLLDLFACVRSLRFHFQDPCAADLQPCFKFYFEIVEIQYKQNDLSYHVHFRCLARVGVYKEQLHRFHFFSCESNSFVLTVGYKYLHV